MDIIREIEALFVSYPFAKDCLLILLSVILGAIFTAIINNGAIKKQSKFNLQYEILKREFDKVVEMQKSVENLEIILSFSKEEISVYKEDIEKVNHLLLKTNESLRENRKFVRKYISAKSVEFSAQLVSDYLSLMYDKSKGLFEFEVVVSFDANKIQRLRIISEDARNLENQLSESLEKLISPGMFSGLKRKFRKPLMFFEELMAIISVSKSRRKSK